MVAGDDVQGCTSIANARLQGRRRQDESGDRVEAALDDYMDVIG
ncbi:MAG: hypothetical protein HW386_1302 [Gammaproteobacteria bacterium]|nr:hypothetical protein [Gammaproteobacteria bacterium]